MGDSVRDKPLNVGRRTKGRTMTTNIAGTEIVAWVSFNTNTQVVNSSYNCADVHETGVGTATVTLDEFLGPECVVIPFSHDDANTCAAVPQAAPNNNLVDVTIVTAAAGAAADAPAGFLVLKREPGAANCTYTP